ncbi:MULTISPECIES: LacI family DNA-binding transcriptional regulator [Acutalibacteraceae]|uniref:LacI family DNA-binding transcriptional regulator n=1 Tax=Acutalibacteraceae TaxID=3082771 RepID=UPI0013E8AE1D|nr:MULTISPECIES: LacI family DNA-binding transcriptional regulator [Acutalibacteraceae]
MKEKHVTIDLVAQTARVSKTTVSRFLNGKFDSMSAETRDRIQKVIEDLEYHPSRIARSLKASSRQTIGCVIADVGSPFSSILLKGINDICSSSGYQVLFSDSNNRPKREIDCIQKLLEHQVDGLILNTTGGNDGYLAELSQRGVPIVLADRSIEPRDVISTVTTDNYRSAYACIKHLFENGYRKIAFFTQGNGTVSPRVIRYRAYLDAMRELYREDGGPSSYVIDENDIKSCTDSLADFIGRHPAERCAVFAVNGVTSLAVLQAARQGGYPIGEGLGLCGFDDWGWASLVPPGITTITQDSYGVGTRSAKLLLRRLRGKSQARPQYIELPNHLNIRGSTSPDRG